MFLVTARINFESYPKKLFILFRVFGWQIFENVVPTDTYSTIFHNAVLPTVVDDVKDRISIECLQSSLGCYMYVGKERTA